MPDWKTEIVRIRSSICGLHEAIEKYLELTGHPDSVSVDDIETVAQLTGMLAPTMNREGFMNFISKFMVSHGFNSIPADDGFYKRCG